MILTILLTMPDNIFIRLPGETEAQARERLAIIRGDFRTEEERRADRQAEALELQERTINLLKQKR